ncbi:hypothetical protein, partial [Streptomyces sp. NRRL WC-3549]|uniref:hypothetical protein n=1 Tax=Streptomyces sp. NRRL WC-3549 TaxID=1463925 RepID=UPI00131B6D13
MTTARCSSTARVVANENPTSTGSRSPADPETRSTCASSASAVFADTTHGTTGTETSTKGSAASASG